MIRELHAKISYCVDTKMWKYDRSLDDVRLYSLKWVAVGDAKKHLRSGTIDSLTVYTKNRNVDFSQLSKRFRQVVHSRAQEQRRAAQTPEPDWKKLHDRAVDGWREANELNRKLIDANRKLMARIEKLIEG